VQVNNVRTEPLQEPVKLPYCPRETARTGNDHVEAIAEHPLAKRAHRPDYDDERIVPKLPLRDTHLRDKRLHTAYFHAVHYMCDLHAAAGPLQTAVKNSSQLSQDRRLEE
jgi:hypothetical protein